MGGVACQIQCVLQSRGAIRQAGIVQRHAVILTVGAANLEGGCARCRGGLERRVSQVEIADRGGQRACRAGPAEDLAFGRQCHRHIELPARCTCHR